MRVKSLKKHLACLGLAGLMAGVASPALAASSCGATSCSGKKSGKDTSTQTDDDAAKKNAKAHKAKAGATSCSGEKKAGASGCSGEKKDGATSTDEKKQ